MYRRKTRRTFSAKWIAAIVFLLLIAFASVITVMAAGTKVTVVDGKNEISVTAPKLSVEEIMKKAEAAGIEPLDGLDEAAFDPQTQTLTIYRERLGSVTDNGKTYLFPVSSRSQTEDEILNAFERAYPENEIGREDDVVFDDSTKKATILRAMNVTLTNDGVEKTLVAHYGETVSDLLKRENITVHENDSLNCAPEDPIYENMSLVYQTQAKITLSIAGDSEEKVVPIDTVEKTLEALSVSLDDYDTINVSFDTVISEGMEIEIHRVSYEEITQDEIIDYEIIERYSDDYYEGNTHVETYGEEGVRRITKRLKYVDYELDDIEILSDEVIEEPVDKVVLIGTKERESGSAGSGYDGPDDGMPTASSGTFIDYNGNVVRYKELKTGNCTAYYGGGITATGRPAQVGNVAVNPYVIPYGTRMYICSPDGSFVYGYAVAADTGGVLMSGYGLIDCYYDTYEECCNFGLRYMHVYILE